MPHIVHKHGMNNIVRTFLHIGSIKPTFSIDIKPITGNKDASLTIPGFSTGGLTTSQEFLFIPMVMPLSLITIIGQDQYHREHLHDFHEHDKILLQQGLKLFLIVIVLLDLLGLVRLLPYL